MSARFTPRARALVIGAVLVVAAIVGGAAIRDAVSVDVAQTTAVQQAAPLARVCAQDPGAAARAGADCATAAAIVRDGVDGQAGKDGRGIVGTSVNGGRLIVAYSDGSTQDAGRVIGDNGQPGTPGVDGKAGADGRGITDSSVEGGRLVVTYSDGTTADLGPVVGADGRGIASVAAVDGRLIVTFTDGDVQDAGPLPVGPKGDTGEAGAPAPVIQSSTKTYTDGSVERCTRNGGTDTDPAFACERTAPPSEAPPTGEPQPDPPILGG